MEGVINGVVLGKVYERSFFVGMFMYFREFLILYIFEICLELFGNFYNCDYYYRM